MAHVCIYIPINLNLSTSLQLYSMPFWPWPPLPLLCHLTRALPLFFSFSSTFTLCLIALDRHHLIVDDGQVEVEVLVEVEVQVKVEVQVFLT